MDLGSALMALMIGGVVKLSVMGFGAWLLVRVYRATHGAPPSRPWLLLPNQDSPEIRILWWALVLFYLSELTCGIEIYVIFHSNPFLSGFHSIASATGMGLFALGLYLQLDSKVFYYGRKQCFLNRVCHGCTIQEEEGCKFRTILLLTGTFVALAAAAPLFASIERMNADTSRYILPFPSLNAWYDGSVVPWLLANVPGYQPSGVAYFLPESMLFIEFRLIPLLGMGVAVTAILLLYRGRVIAGTKTLTFAVGLLCYSYFELVLYRATNDVILGSLGHEVAEFWFLVFTAEYLRRAYAPGKVESPVTVAATA